MYKKSVQGWLKHLDFMILDVVCLWISFTLAFNMRHGSLDVLANSLYRDMMWSLALMDIVVIFFFDSLKNVLKRGFYQEFVMTVKQTCLITLCSVFYLHLRKQRIIQDLYLGIQQRCIYYSVTSCAVFGRIASANTLAEPKSVLSLS